MIIFTYEMTSIYFVRNKIVMNRHFPGRRYDGIKKYRKKLSKDIIQNADNQA